MTELRRVCATPGCATITTRAHCTEHEHARYSRSAWQRVRTAALRRAGHRCQRCGTSERTLVVHHAGPSATPSTTIVLCRRCHAAAHQHDHHREGDGRAR